MKKKTLGITDKSFRKLEHSTMENWSSLFKVSSMQISNICSPVVTARKTTKDHLVH